MNIAKYEYKVHNLEFEVIKQNEWNKLMELVKQEVSQKRERPDHGSICSLNIILIVLTQKTCFILKFCLSD